MVYGLWFSENRVWTAPNWEAVCQIVSAATGATHTMVYFLVQGETEYYFRKEIHCCVYWKNAHRIDKVDRKQIENLQIWSTILQAIICRQVQLKLFFF